MTLVKRHQYLYPLRPEFRSNASTPEAKKLKLSKVSRKKFKFQENGEIENVRLPSLYVCSFDYNYEYKSMILTSHSDMNVICFEISVLHCPDQNTLTFTTTYSFCWRFRTLQLSWYWKETCGKMKDENRSWDELYNHGQKQLKHSAKKTCFLERASFSISIFHILTCSSLFYVVQTT